MTARKKPVRNNTHTHTHTHARTHARTHAAAWEAELAKSSQVLLTDTVVSAPFGWKLQETVVNPPVVLVDLNLHVSFPCVPFATKISFGV
jgi:hypothetical protein